MKGILKKTEAGWFIWQSDKITSHFKSYVLHPDDAKICNQYGDYSMDWIDKEVEFETIDENSLRYATMDKGYKKPNVEQLETKLDNALANETAESLTTWLSTKMKYVTVRYDDEDMIDFADWIARDWMSIWVENKWMWEYQKEVGPHHEYHGYLTSEQLFKMYLVDKTN